MSSPESASSAKLEVALDALSNRYRRELLTALVESNPQDDDDRDPLDLIDAPAEPEALQTELIHVHLPKLEDMGFIEWNRETGEISKGPEWESIAPLLTLMRDHGDELPDGWL